MIASRDIKRGQHKQGYKIIRFWVLLTLILCTSLLSACSKSAKNDRDIANDLAKLDRYFQSYNLNLDAFTVIKRQTNKEDKTDYVWITINGSNAEFEYSADYELEYVLYNDGWLLEKYNLIDSSYVAVSPFDPIEIEAKLAKEYDNISAIKKAERTNAATITYTAEKRDEFFTTHYTITVDAKFSPSTWEVTNIDYKEGKRELNIVGEWIYEDKDGRYYYMHISAVNEKTATINYLFVNTSRTDEWNYISSDGYQQIKLKTYSSKYTGEDEYLLYFHLKNGSGIPSGAGGDIDFGWLWLEKTRMTDGKTFSGFTINKKYLTRVNSSKDPVIGIDETKAMKQPVSEDSSNENMTDGEKIVFMLNEGKVQDALAYIATLTEKDSQCQRLEEEINKFNETYGRFLGTWKKEGSSAADVLTFSCRYEDKVILCLELGQTIEGERKLFDLVEEDGRMLYFHSDRFDPEKYHIVYRYKTVGGWSWNLIDYSWSTTSGLSTIGSDYYKE